MVVGIIAEYNPFHKGHEYHIAKTREELGDAGCVAIMSGNCVQRGELSAFEKHARAEAAIRCGCDLVLELHPVYALSSAGGFALGAVATLDALGVVDTLSFGSECGDIESLKTLSKALSQPEIDVMIKEYVKDGAPYAAARFMAAEAVCPDLFELLNEANNNLGVEYLIAIDRVGSKITPFTIERFGVRHDDMSSGEYTSAKMLRSRIFGGKEISPFVPLPAFSVYEHESDEGRAPLQHDHIETAMIATLRMYPEEGFKDLPGCGGGLGRRLARAAKTGSTLDEIAAMAKAKNYAMSSVRRAMLCACMGIKAADFMPLPPYVKVLAFNERGQVILKEISEKSSIPVIVKPASGRKIEGADRYLEIDSACTDFYVLAYPDRDQAVGGSEWMGGPVIVNGDAACGE